ncbi:unnamed protein product [Orchesella dallaii]|uniref:Chitin-binding type-2 domain-containing protein n=1 Tax=Orchesella dallaii TaxID=48710 RepID=A0ABP1Q0P7_9HEXA
MARGRKLVLITSWSPAHKKSVLTLSISLIILVFNSISVNGNALKTELDEECRQLRLTQGGSQLTKIKVPGSCSYFAYCVGSKAELGNCPKGLLFNADTQDCDLPEKVECEKVENADEACPPDHCGIFENSDTCTKFAICSEGRTIWNSECGEGTRFEDAVLACLPADQVPCPPRASFPEGRIINSEIEAELKKTKSGEYDQLCSKFWKGGINKVIHPKDCSKFFYCFDGRAKLAACPLGLLYNASTGHCDYVDNVTPCMPFSLSVWALAGPKECISRPCGIYPSADCEAYTVCKGGQGQIKKCKEGYKFDTDSGICQLSETAVCWDQPSPTQNVGFDRNVGTSNHSISRDVCPFHNKPASKPSETETNSVVLFSKSDVDFGTWSEWKNCPEGKYVNGLQNFRRMVMSEDADIVDHAGLTTIAFVCNTPEEFPGDIREIIDEVPPGLKRRPLEKMNFFKCEFGPAVGFQLNQVPSQGDGDDLATDWIKLICGCGQDAIKPYDKAEFKEVSGTRGVWSEPKICGARQSICGLSAQLHPWVENRNLEEYDNTGVNGVKLRCCDVPSPATKYSPSESLLSIATLENFGNEPSLSFQVELNVGLLYNRTGKWKKAMNFYETIGYNLNSLSHPFHKVFSEKVSCLSDSSCNFDWSAHEDERNDEAGMWGMAAISNVTVNVKKGTKVEVKQVVGVAGPYVIGTFAVKEIITVVEEGEDGVEEMKETEGRTIDLTAVTQVEPGNIGGILNPGPIISTTFDAATCPFMPREEETVHFSDEVDGFIIASRPRKDIVSDGTWMEEDECGPGKYVVGITGHRDVVLGSGKKQVDYAGLTSIGFKCESPGLRDTEYMSFSAPGLAAWPVWNTSKWFDCDEGAAIGFEINAKQEITKEEPDDFATDNIKLHCSCGPSVVNPFDSTELDPAIQGVAHGTWRKGRYCSKKHTVCGLQTQMHTFQDEYSPIYDNTGLNEIRVKCCKVPDPTEKYLLRESRQLLVSLKPEPNKEKKPSTLLVPIGVQLNNSKTSARRMNFYESIGYPVANMRLTLKEKLKVLGKECQPQCMYHWEHYQSQILQDVETHEESVVVPDPVEEGETVEYYQVVASIGFFIVRTNKYIIVTEDSKKKREIAVTIPFEDESRKRKGSAWNSVKSLRNSEDDEEAEEKQAEVKEEEILADNEHKPGDTYEMKPGDKVDSEETDLGGGGDQDDSSDSPSIAGGRAFGLNKTMGGKKEEKREPAAVVAGDANENECQYHNLPPSESHEITEGGIILPNSPKLMEHGEWRDWQYCPESQYVVGLTAYREILETGDGGVDKVGLTAIGFICQNPADANVGRKDRGLGLASEATNASQLLFSTDDLNCPRYLWKRWYFCRPGYVGIGFQTLGLEPLKELGDDIGIQNVKMFCSSGKEQGKPYDDNFFAGDKGVGASWGSKQVCKRGQAICGAQVQIQDIVREANNIDEFDNTGINNINLKCCDVPFPDTLESFNPSERRVLITDIDRREEGKTFKEYYNVTLNVGTEMSKSNVNCFYTSIGYDMTNIKDKFAKHVTTEGAVPCAAKRCDISWQGLKTEVFGQTKSVTSKHKVIGGQQIKTYQVVADAGPFLVKTNQYVQHIVNKGVKSGIGGREVGALKNKWILFEMPLSDGKSPQLKLKVFDVVAPQRFNGTTAFGDKSLAPVKETGKKKGFYDLISSPRITDNGEWQEWIQCPKGSFVAGIHAFRRVIMENGEDQLGISSVGFICTTPTGEVTRKFGFVTQNLQARNWTAYKYTQCDAGLATGFQLNVMKDLGPAGDDIA